MNQINTFTDLKQWVSDQLLNIDPSQYIEFDVLVENVASDLMSLFKEKYDFKYGQEIPNFKEDFFIDICSPYEK